MTGSSKDNPMKRLLIDMDGVLADIYSQLLAYDKRATGRRKAAAEIVGKREADVFVHLQAHLVTPGFFRDAPVMAGCEAVLLELNRRYELFIVSAATEFPLSMGEKHAWMQEYFSFITWQQLVFCGSKRVVCGDIMIDDHFKNLDGFAGRAMLFTQPHNQGSDCRGHERVDSWTQIAERLL